MRRVGREGGFLLAAFFFFLAEMSYDRMRLFNLNEMGM